MDLDPEKVIGECRITYTLSPGPGGQRRDKKRTAVRLKHMPTGIVVVAGRRRSRAQNQEDAIQRLILKIEERTKEKKPRKETSIPGSVKKAILEGKKRRSIKKQLRKKVDKDEES
jgi:protein subunit release factor B